MTTNIFKSFFEEHIQIVFQQHKVRRPQQDDKMVGYLCSKWAPHHEIVRHEIVRHEIVRHEIVRHEIVRMTDFRINLTEPN